MALKKLLSKTKSAFEFKSLLRRATAHTKKKDFDSAVRLYSEIASRYDKLGTDYKDEKIKKDVSRLYTELILYMKLKEAHIFSSEGNLTKLNEVLNAISNYVEQAKKEGSQKEVVDHAEKNYSHYLNFYNYQTIKKQFEDTLNKSYNFLNKKELNDSLKEYHKLVSVYKQFIKYECYDGQVRAYHKLRHLYGELRINFMDNTTKKNGERKLYSKPHKNFNVVRKLISEGDYTEAADLYHDVIRKQNL